MKLSEIKLLEEVSTYNMYDFLEEHCGPIAKELGLDPKNIDPDEVPLWRGVQLERSQQVLLKDPDGLADIKGYIKTVRLARTPLDTNIQLSNVIDDMFEEKFGWRARSQSTFVYGERGKARTGFYGKLCRILPMGEFKYIWNYNVKDLTLELPNLLKSAGLPELFSRKTSQYTKDQLSDFYEAISDKFESGFKDTDLLDAATNSNAEILIKCKQYLAIPYKD